MRSLLGIVMVYLLAYTPDLEDASDPTPSGNGDPSHKDNSTKEAEKCTIVKYSKERYMEFHNKVRGSEGSSNMIELVSFVQGRETVDYVYTLWHAGWPNGLRSCIRR